MRLCSLILILTGVAACSRIDRADETRIEFVTRTVQSPSLRVNPTLIGYPDEQRIELNLELKNLQPDRLKIVDVALQSSKGLKSSAEGIKALTIAGTNDTTLVLSFNPINDRALFMATGLPGIMDSVYNVSVYYSIDGKEGTRIVNLISQMTAEDFLSYQESYNTPIHIFYLNTTNGFIDKQRQFLTTRATTNTPPFVHITEQELAVSGLNFRVKCFHRKDSLHAEVFVVNHSDVTVRIDHSKFDVVGNGIMDDTPASVSNEKVTGSKTEAGILRKGDRSVIKLRKYVRNVPEKLSLTVGRTFLLANGEPLLTDNLELIPSLPQN